MFKNLILWLGVAMIVVCSTTCEDPTAPAGGPMVVPELVPIEEHLLFTMGCETARGFICVHRDVLPSFTAFLTPYAIGKYEVRNDEFQYFVEAGGYTDSTLWSESGWEYIQSEHRTHPVGWQEGMNPWRARPYSNTAEKPVCDIAWYEAEAYCNWLSRETGDTFTLPTEAQWERAARGPDPGRVFAYGNEHDASKYNNMMYSSTLYPVGSFPEDVTVEGCYDMAGNVVEFCADLYQIDIYHDYKANEPVVNPAGPAQTDRGTHAIRGSFNFFHQDPAIEYQIQTITRMNLSPDDHSPIFGFRIVRKSSDSRMEY